MSHDEQLSNAPGALGEKELDKLRNEVAFVRERLNQLMHVNSQWDLEYREQEEAFRRYREDAQLAAREAREAILRLKEENEGLKIKLNEPHPRKSSLGGEAQRQEGNLLGGQELEIYEQQLRVYQEDFAAERREKERLMEERRNEMLRSQADITSLQLQLDRCKTELAHYSTESTRLAQQLKIRSQADQEQYRRYLESKGYVTRSPDKSLPPLDPFVEPDHTHHNPHRKHSEAGVQRLLSNPLTDQRRHSLSDARAPPLDPHPCPRCARRFAQCAELQDHMTKCLQY